MKSFSKYSKMENFKQLLLAIKEKASSYREDTSYNINYTPDTNISLVEYSSICGRLYQSGMYDFEYSDEFYNPEYSEEKQEMYNFKYKIYAPGDIMITNMGIARLNPYKHILYPFIFLAICIFVAMKTGIYILAAYAIPPATAYMIFMFIKMMKLRMFIQDIPSAKIESVAVGLNEIKGTVLETNSIPSPISGIKCVYFRYKKMIKIEDSSETKWETAEIGEYLPEHFYVQQRGKRIAVETKGAVFDLHNKQEYSKTLNTLYYGGHNPNIKYIEENIPVMADVYILGSVITKDYDDELRAYIRDRKTDREYADKFDLNTDRIIDNDEWDSMKTAIEKEFADKMSGLDPNELLKIAKTKDDKMLFISDISEKQILTRLKMFLLADALIAALFVFAFIFIFRR